MAGSIFLLLVWTPPSPLLITWWVVDKKNWISKWSFNWFHHSMRNQSVGLKSCLLKSSSVSRNHRDIVVRLDISIKCFTSIASWFDSTNHSLDSTTFRWSGQWFKYFIRGTRFREANSGCHIDQDHRENNSHSLYVAS